MFDVMSNLDFIEFDESNRQKTVKKKISIYLKMLPNLIGLYFSRTQKEDVVLCHADSEKFAIRLLYHYRCCLAHNIARLSHFTNMMPVTMWELHNVMF